MLNEQLTARSVSSAKTGAVQTHPDYAVTGKYEPEWLDKLEPRRFAVWKNINTTRP
jgi:thymidylate synthase